MTVQVHKNTLKNVFDDDFDVQVDIVHDEGAAPEEPPVVVFILPGIRSDREWAYVFTHRTFSPTARRIIPEIITGPSDLGASDLVLRHRMKSFRNDYLNQINSAVDTHQREFGEIEVVFICHSMGSSIFSEIFEEISNDLSRKKTNIKNIIFLGSVAKRKGSDKLGKNKKLINDVGQKDIWPVAAWIINPWKYDHVGRFGFGRALVTDRIFEENNHTSCTSKNHLEEWVLPIIEDGIIKMSVLNSKGSSFNTYRAIKKFVWSAPLVIPLYIFYMYM